MADNRIGVAPDRVAIHAIGTEGGPTLCTYPFDILARGPQIVERAIAIDDLVIGEVDNGHGHAREQDILHIECRLGRKAEEGIVAGYGFDADLGADIKCGATQALLRILFQGPNQQNPQANAQHRQGNDEHAGIPGGNAKSDTEKKRYPAAQHIPGALVWQFTAGDLGDLGRAHCARST